MIHPTRGCHGGDSLPKIKVKKNSNIWIYKRKNKGAADRILKISYLLLTIVFRSGGQRSCFLFFSFFHFRSRDQLTRCFITVGKSSSAFSGNKSRMCWSSSPHGKVSEPRWKRPEPGGGTAERISLYMKGLERNFVKWWKDQ